MKSSSKFVCINLLVLFFVVSCGGGGGGGSPTPPEPSPTSSLSSSSSSVLIDTVITLTWSSTNATSCTASGTWSGTKATSGTEDVTIATPGNNQFTITCSGAGGSQAASVTVEGYRNTEGVSVDGYIRQAEIFIDTNDSYTADSGEDTTTSDNDGKFTIKYSDGNLISLGGTDLDSGNALDNLLIVHKLTGHSNFKAVTPVTSVAAFMADESLVNAALGIDASLDIATFDPVAGKGDGGINDYLYEKGNQLTVLAYALQNITNNLNTTTETTQDYFKAIAEELDTEYSDTETRVNIETEAFITKVLNNIVNIKSLTLDDTNKANTISALAAVLPVIQVKADSANTTAIFDFATSTLQTDAQAIANGTASAATVTSYQTDILNYVANDQNVVADELVPDISALPDSVTIDEDSSVEVSVLANDSYNTTSSIDVVLDTSPSDGSASLSNNVVSYVPDANFFGSDEIAYTITQGDKTSSSSVAISINSINDVPTFDNLLSSYTVDENQTAVTSISASDVEDEALTISISGTDEASFNLSSSNVLTFAESPDYETQTSYALVVSVTDGIDTLNKDLSVNLNNLNDNLPVFTSSSSFSADENQTAIGAVVASDADGDSVTYTASGSDIVIDSVTGVITFSSAPDYETKTSFTSLVTATDGLNSSTQDITIAVNNLNDNSPVLTSVTDFTIDENTSAVGTISGSDADGDVLAYSINGTDADSLSIDSGSGVLSFNETTDYETKTSYSLNLIISDGVNSVTNAATISINNLNDNSPIFSSAETFSMAENESSIGTASATDADTGSSVSYSVDNSVNQKVEVSVAANANGSGNVYVISGVQKKALFLEVGKTYSFEHPTAHPLRFSTTADGTHGSGAAYTDGVDTSTDGISLITVSAETPALYYYCSIHSGMGNDATPSSNNFPKVGVDATSGALTFNPRPDFETIASFSAKLSASDGEIITDQNIQINVTDVDPEGPVFSTPSSFNADENQTDIGTVAAEDPFGETVTYSLSGTDADSISIDSSSGALTFNSAPDFETKSSYLIIITADGSIADTLLDVTVNVNNLNDNSPVLTSGTTFSGAENQTEVGSVTASDADGDSISYSVSGTDLSINSEGVLTFSTAPDYESTTSFTATITATDGTFSDTQNITVNVTNIDDVAPVITSSASFSAAENQTAVGTVTATDVDSSSTSFSVSGEGLSMSTSGVLTFSTAPDFETQSSYSGTVTATDGINSSTQSITVTVTNVNEAPVFTSSTLYDADENQTSIGEVTATDVDSSSLTYSVTGSNFAITADGTLTFTSAPDYETKTSYIGSVTVTDGGLSASQPITVTINNLNDNSPVFTSLASFSAAENQTAIGAVTATDVDEDSVTFTVSGSELAITSAGVLTFASAPDYETKSSYTATVTASDGTNTTTQSITVNVTDVNDNSPVFTSSATFSVAENQASIGSVTTTDADNGNTISYSVDNAVTQKIEVSIAANSSGSGDVYVISGVQKKSLTLEIGKTYRFEHPTAHPFRFSTTVDGIHGSGSAYTAGVDTSTSGVTLITVSSDTPSALYYYCNVHSGMGSDVTSSSNSFPAISVASSGALTFTPPADFETLASFSAKVTANDGINTTDQDIQVNITDQDDTNEAPVMSLTQPNNNEGDSLYPLVLTNDENKLDINLSFSDAETSVNDLLVTATTTAGASISIFHEEGSDISTIDLSNADAGPTDITISVSDGVETVTDTLKIWITRYIAIDNPSDPYSGNRAYTILGNHSNESRKSNYVILSDALPNEDRVNGFRNVVKSWVNLINQTEAAEILDKFFSIGIIETPLSSESAIGTETGCDSRDPNIYCYKEEWKTALDSLQGQYFDDVDSRSVISGIDGRGVANPGWAVNIQDIPSTDAPTLRRVVYTLKHEFGHSYSLLADEYTTSEVNCTDFNCGQIELGPNTTAEDEPEKVRWNHHIEDLTNIPGYHDSTTGEGIGYYKGVYYGADAGFRPSFATVMGATPSQWLANGGDIPRELLWDKIGQEVFAIRALIFQGMHSIETAFDANNDLIVSHNFVDPSGAYEVEWYLNGEKVENDSNTFLLERKSSGYEHVSYRIKEKTQNMIIANDNILNFRDVYSGLYGPAGPYTTDSLADATSAGCNAVLTDNSDYANSYCRNTLNIKWTPFSPIYDYFFYDDVDDLINSAETSSWGLQYWYEYSGLGAMFGINWEAN